MQSWKLKSCAIACALALAGCASRPSTSVTAAVQRPQMQAPAAWAITPSRSMSAFQSVFSISGMQSAKTPQRLGISESTQSSASGFGVLK